MSPYQQRHQHLTPDSIGYLTAKKQFLGYDTALQAGWPIACSTSARSPA